MWLAAEMAIFALAAELGSFTAVARTLGVPKVAVSRAIASLERATGQRLLARTTRRMSLTPAGTLLLPYCRRVLAEVQAVRAGFCAAPAAAPRLRVLTDGGFGRMLVNPLVPRFLEHFPQFSLEVQQAEALPQEPGPAWDLLICNDPPVHPGLERIELGRPAQILCATPAYLRRHGTPRQPAELLAHALLQAGAGEEAALSLGHGEERRTLRWRPTLRVEDPGLVHACASAGLGIAVLPEFLCRQGLALGKLERVLPDWTLEEPLELYAVHAAHGTDPAAIRVFVEFLLANFVPALAAGP